MLFIIISHHQQKKLKVLKALIAKPLRYVAAKFQFGILQARLNILRHISFFCLLR
jgi:hypothetical protein